MLASSAAVIEQELKVSKCLLWVVTIALHHGNYDDAGYTADKSVDQTLFAVTMAF